MINLNISKKVFNEAYFPHLFDYSNRYEVYYGRAGSRKSVFVCQKLLVKACASKRKTLVVRKFGTTLKDSVFQLFVDTLKKWKLYEYCKINLTNFTITLPNESTFLFKGLDDSEKIKSITDITDIWCEEGTELTLDEFTQLDLRLRANVDGLQMFISFNPVSKQNWVFKRWFSEGSTRKNTMVLHTTYKDNKFLPVEYINSLLEQQKTNPTYYRIYALREFCTLDKLVYYNWKVENFDHSKIQGKLLVGLDFGFVNDPSALVASICKDKNIYIFKEWGATNKTNDEIAEIIKQLGFAKSTIIADSAEQKSIEELRRKNIYAIKPSTKGPDSIIHGIQRVQQYNLIVHPSCTETIIELENYSWEKDKKTGEYINKPQDLFNHYLDALRYSLQCMGNEIKTFKQPFGL